MPKLYEHLHVDITPRALDWLAGLIEESLADTAEYEAKGYPAHVLGDPTARVELQNLANECRARLQHVAIGQGDTLPNRSGEEWLDGQP